MYWGSVIFRGTTEWGELFNSTHSVAIRANYENELARIYLPFDLMLDLLRKWKRGSCLEVVRRHHPVDLYSRLLSSFCIVY